MMNPMQWRSNHPRCAFCKYLKYDTTATRLGLNCSNYYKCLIKKKIINFPEMPRPWCQCFNAKYIDFDKEINTNI